MISASNARCISLENICKEDKLMLDDIEIKILKAAKNGKTTCYLTYKLTDNVLSVLKKEGYKVYFFSSEYGQISWLK